MALQTINYGGYDNDPTADKIRVAFQKAQEMFSELYENISVTGLDGYMVKNTYDPDNKGLDVYSMDSMDETPTRKIMTSQERINLAAAYGWGNHALAGYLTSFTEADPVFTAWLAANTWKVEAFTATAGQNYTVQENAIADNGRWKVWVNGIRWYADSGVASFGDGLLAVNFATGVITFKEALRTGDKVIVEYI